MRTLTLEDINKYITMIRINFENAYKSHTKEERDMLYASWYTILKDYPKEICDKAVINAIKNAEFAPRIGTIVKEIEKMMAAYEKSESELWAELTSVLGEVDRCSHSFRYTFIDSNGLTQGENARKRVQEIFDGLSQELKDYIRTAKGLQELASYTKEDLSYERGRFMRMMPEVKERSKTRQDIPDSLAAIVQGLANQFTLGSGNQNLLGGGK